MKELQEKDLIYLAGFIDGDGSIFAQIVKKPDYKHKFQIRVTLQLTQLTKRRWFLDKIQNLIGAGTVRERGQISDYVLVEPANVAALLKQLKPFLIIKQKQANLVLRIIEQLPSTKDSLDKFLELCDFVDQVASLNDSKKRTNTAQTVKATLKRSDNGIVPVETSDDSFLLK